MENIPAMTKSTFEIQTDPKTGLRFVTKAMDEPTQKTSGIITESPGSEYCPVQSFAKYISKLHPSCDRLWQKARDYFDDSDKTWYYNAPVGEKTLGNFMASLSKLCRLSHIYTIHSIRATGATMLAKNNYCDTQIMAVTGHKSVAAYSCISA